MNTNNHLNNSQQRNTMISDKSLTSQLTNKSKKSQNLKASHKNENLNANSLSYANLSMKSGNLSNNILNKSMNPKEEKVRESIRMMFNETTMNRVLSKKSNNTNIQSPIISDNNRELKIKFSDNLRKILPYEEQIKHYLKKNFDNKFLCSLCWGLFKEPMTCYKCNNIFCKECLKSQLDKKGKCSSCFNIIFFDQLKFYENDDYEILYDKTILNCVYYPVCKKMCNLYEINEHMNDCIFKELKIKYDEICSSNFNNFNIQNTNNNIYNNEILESNEIFKFHKLDYSNKDKDPFLKFHLFDYLEKLNKVKPSESFENISKSVGSTDITANNKKNKLPLNMEIMKDFKSKLNQLNTNMSALNTRIGDTIIDLANITKASNDKMKMMINN